MYFVANISFAQVQSLLPYTKATLNGNEVELNNLGFVNGEIKLIISVPKELLIENGFIQFNFPFLDSIHIYTSDGQLITQLGDAFKYRYRLLNHKSFLIPISKTQMKQGLWVSIYCNGEYTRVPINYGMLDELKQSSNLNLFQGAYYGVLVFSLILALLLLSRLREKEFLWYAVFILFTFIFQYSIDGFTFEYWLPNQPWLSNRMIPFSGAGALLSLLIFTNSLFEKNINGVFRKSYYIFIFLLSITIVFSFLKNPFYGYSLIGASLFSVPLNIYLFSIGIKSYFKKQEHAVYFILSFGILITAIIITQFRNQGLVGDNFIFQNILQIASGIQVMLLSFSLAQKISVYQLKEKKAQQLLLKELNEKAEAQVRLNIELEEKVKLRTADLNTKKEELEIVNGELTQSITYASYIQNSILPSVAEINKIAKEIFVLFRPKDIVSGDFYWCKNVSNTFKIIAAVDCTGHGVPGAFMSLIANNLLNQAMQNFTMPNDIIQFINTNLRSAINANDKTQSLNDGMDISLLAIDYSINKVYYAGANRPLYYFENNNSDLLELRGDKMAVGGYTTLDYNWQLHEINAKPNDTFYLFSDGITDQFGGQNDKKITSKRIRDSIVANKLLPLIDQQKAIDGFFMSWKGGTPQTDDVLLIGVKY